MRQKWKSPKGVENSPRLLKGRREKLICGAGQERKELLLAPQVMRGCGQRGKGATPLNFWAEKFLI